MSTANLLVGGVLVAGVMQAALTMALPSVDFLTVHDVSYIDEMVTADRTVNRSAIADWRVTIVPADNDGPVCNTTPGNNIHEGWSPYVEGARAESAMHIDEWVGDTGCADRLIPGKKYNMFMAWTPRGEAQPVSHKIRFTP